MVPSPNRLTRAEGFARDHIGVAWRMRARMRARAQVLLGSQQAEGIAYIETANLDGETNLKTRTSPMETQPICGGASNGGTDGGGGGLRNLKAKVCALSSHCALFTERGPRSSRTERSAATAALMGSWPRRTASLPSTSIPRALFASRVR